MIAWVAHWFGVSPMVVREWKRSDIATYYNEATKAHELEKRYEQSLLMEAISKLFGGEKE